MYAKRGNKSHIYPLILLFAFLLSIFYHLNYSVVTIYFLIPFESE
jgi:hypothetical protein